MTSLIQHRNNISTVSNMFHKTLHFHLSTTAHTFVVLTAGSEKLCCRMKYGPCTFVFAVVVTFSFYFQRLAWVLPAGKGWTSPLERFWKNSSVLYVWSTCHHPFLCVRMVTTYATPADRKWISAQLADSSSHSLGAPFWRISFRKWSFLASIIPKGVSWYLLPSSSSPMNPTALNVHSTVRFQLWLPKISAGAVT